MRLLLTRPEPECSRSAELLMALGHDVVKAPMLKPVSCAPPVFRLDNVTMIAVTSARAACCLMSHPQREEFSRLRGFAVGDTTAATLRELGVASVRSAQGDVHALADLIGREKINGTVFYPSAVDRAVSLENLLANQGISCVAHDVYRMEMCAELPADTLLLLRQGRLDGVLIYSRRTAQAFLLALKQAGLEHCLQYLRIYGISAAAIQDFPEGVYAKQPTEKALFDLVLRGL